MIRYARGLFLLQTPTLIIQLPGQLANWHPYIYLWMPQGKADRRDMDNNMFMNCYDYSKQVNSIE